MRLLTFEVLGDEAAVSACEILADASNGIIDAAASEELKGYAIYGSSIRSGWSR